MSRKDKRSDDARPWRNWYKLARWERRRQALFAEQPLCAMCLEREEITEADTADHIIQHRGDPVLFWHGELQALCASCHSMHKQREELGTERPAYGVDGYPI